VSLFSYFFLEILKHALSLTCLASTPEEKTTKRISAQDITKQDNKISLLPFKEIKLA
jgi:hypothetical protein